MRARRIQNTLKNEKGQSLVEFALVVPLLLLLVIGIAEFGRAWMTKNILTGAAREAVRMYAVKDDTAAATARAINILSSAALDNALWNIVPIQGADGSLGYRVEYNFPLAIAGFIPGLSGTSILLSSTTTMRREWDIVVP